MFLDIHPHMKNQIKFSFFTIGFSLRRIGKFQYLFNLFVCRAKENTAKAGESCQYRNLFGSREDACFKRCYDYGHQVSISETLAKSVDTLFHLIDQCCVFVFITRLTRLFAFCHKSTEVSSVFLRVRTVNIMETLKYFISLFLLLLLLFCCGDL